MFELEGIDHVALGVRDVARSAQWYIDVLGFEHRYAGLWNGTPVFVGKGQTALALFPAKSEASAPSHQTGRVGIHHLAFRASYAEFGAAQADLKARGIAFTFSDHEISHSIYFADPDGDRLEI